MTETSEPRPVAAPSPKATANGPSRNTRVVVLCSSIVAAMLGLSYAAVPLYEIFCRVTGYGGTTQRADAAPDRVVDRTIQIRFDANRSRELGWRFAPVDRVMTVRIGEHALGFYEAENTGDRPSTGTATFNVTPEIAGSYFAKIDCFCFEEQTLAPGQKVDMPVSFFVDPAILDDPDARDLTHINLSYTFFPVDTEATGEAEVTPTQGAAGG